MTENQPAPKAADEERLLPEHKHRRTLWICGGIVFVLLVAAVYVNLAHSPALRISKETTYITEPLTADGKQVDFIAAIQQATYPPNMATEENGYRLIVEHLGMPPDDTPARFANVCEQLGLDAATLRPDMTYQGPWDFLEAYANSTQFDESLLDALPPDDRSTDSAVTMLRRKATRPWTPDDLPMMAPWLEQNGPALDLIGQAVRKPVFHIPIAKHDEGESLVNVLFPDVRYMRAFSNGLNVRANYRIATGDLDGAIADIVACQRLGRYVGNGASYIDLNIGIVVEGTGRVIGIAGSLEHPPTKEQLGRLLAEMDRLPPASTVQDKTLPERLRGLDLIQKFASGKTSWGDYFGYSPPPTLRLFLSGTDWNVTARRFNELYDEVLATGTRSPIRSFDWTVAVSFLSKSERSRYLADRLFGEWNTCDTILEAVHRNTCRQHMQRITLAMLLYEREHGTLPPAWSVDAKGNPLHSWRVLLLPYLGHETLYEKIRLDEPWDSEYNRQFHGEDMAIFRCPGDPVARPGRTTYSVVVGPDVAFQAGQGKSLADFGPHSDDMILLVERMDPVGWMEPTREISQASADRGMHEMINPFSTAPGPIGSHLPSVVNLGFRNGAVRSLSSDSSDYYTANYSEKALLERFQKLLRGTDTEKDY